MEECPSLPAFCFHFPSLNKKKSKNEFLFFYDYDYDGSFNNTHWWILTFLILFHAFHVILQISLIIIIIIIREIVSL